MEILSQNLKTLRESRNLTLSEVAELLPVSIGAYHHWEKGRCQPPLDALVRLSRYYSVTIDDLVKTNMGESS